MATISAAIRVSLFLGSVMMAFTAFLVAGISPSSFGSSQSFGLSSMFALLSGF